MELHHARSIPITLDIYLLPMRAAKDEVGDMKIPLHQRVTLHVKGVRGVLAFVACRIPGITRKVVNGMQHHQEIN